MPSTTRPCAAAGTYRGDCVCAHRLTIETGGIFPRCPECQRAITWTLVRPLNWNRAETSERKQALTWARAFLEHLIGRFASYS